MHTKLIGVTWPRRRVQEPLPGSVPVTRIGHAVLMMNRVHLILTDPPTIRLTHVGCRGDHQRGRLAVLDRMVRTVPGTLSGKVHGPDVRPTVGVHSVAFAVNETGQCQNSYGKQQHTSVHGSGSMEETKGQFDWRSTRYVSIAATGSYSNINYLPPGELAGNNNELLSDSSRDRCRSSCGSGRYACTTSRGA